MVTTQLPYPPGLWVDHGTGPVRNPDLTDDEFNAGVAELQAQNTAVLWQAAHDYEFAQISGTAIGLLSVGVQKGGPVAMAIQNWCLSIWTLYYQRKPVVSALVPPDVPDPTMLDFSSCGTIPHSIPELMKEVLA